LPKNEAGWWGRAARSETSVSSKEGAAKAAVAEAKSIAVFGSLAGAT
jgi:hypothetical protein